METHVRGSSAFQRIYRTGKRYEGHLLTAFVLPNSLTYHRLGITASRKVLGKAVDRNRAKRLLRETFRTSSMRLDALQGRYDWVLNARKTLLSPEGARRIAEFEKIIDRVASEEKRVSVVESQMA